MDVNTMQGWKVLTLVIVQQRCLLPMVLASIKLIRLPSNKPSTLCRLIQSWSTTCLKTASSKCPTTTMCQECRDAAQSWQAPNPTSTLTDANTQTAIRMHSAEHYQVLQIVQDPSPSKNSRKKTHRKKNKAASKQDPAATDCGDDEINDDKAGDEEQKEATSGLDAASSHSSPASIEIYTDTPAPFDSSVATSIEGHQPTKLPSDLPTAKRQLDGELDKLDDRIRLGRLLRDALERTAADVGVLKAKWNAGL